MRTLLLAAATLTLAACASTGPSIGGSSFAALDTNTDGVLTSDEFEAVDVSFGAVDRNNNGEITTSEISAFNNATSAARTRARSAETGSRL